MKKVLKWLGIGISSIILLVIIASIIMMFIVDEQMIASQMENALNRHVTLKELNVGIFAIASGIEVKDVRISNFKTKKQLAALKDKPVKDKDLFVGLKAFNFKIKFMPLLSGNFVLKELVLYEPIINIIKNKNETFNFDDLTKPAPGAKKVAKNEKKAVTKEKPGESPSKPFTADDLPIKITIGKIGLEKGQLKFVDKKLGQMFQVYNLTALIHSIEIDPDNLNNKDSVAVKIEMGVKTLGIAKSGTVKSFDIVFDIDGSIIPFDKKTRIANPEVTLKVGMPYGTMSGLQIFEKMKSVEQLSKYCGKLNFLKKDMKWKDAYVNAWYKDNVVKLKDGKIPTEDYLFTYAGQTNIKTKSVNMDINMLLADKHEKSIRSGINKNVKKGITGRLKKVVKPEKVTDVAMKRIVNKDGKIDLQYKVTGKMSDPKTKLISPKLPTIKELMKDSAGDLKNVAKDKAKEAAKKMADRVKEKAKEKAASAAKDKLKGKINKKKFGF